MAASPGSLRAGGTDATANAPPASGQPAFGALTASAPQAPLIQAGDGNFYGTTYGGAGTDLSREMRVGYSLGGQAEVGTDYITSQWTIG